MTPIIEVATVAATATAATNAAVATARRHEWP
jgi:hypothetical protein